MKYLQIHTIIMNVILWQRVHPTISSLRVLVFINFSNQIVTGFKDEILEYAAIASAGVVSGRRAQSTAHAQQAARRLHSRIFPVRRSSFRQHTRRPSWPWRHARRQTCRRPHQREPDPVAQLSAARVVERYSGECGKPVFLAIVLVRF